MLSQRAEAAREQDKCQMTRKRSQATERPAKVRKTQLGESLRKLAIRKKRNDLLHSRTYAVAYIDILGASKALLDFRSPFERRARGLDDDNDAFITAIMRVVRPTEWMRQSFHGFFRAAENWEPADPTWQQLTRAQQAQVRQLNKVRVETQAVSDCLILAVSLEEPSKDHLPIGSLSALITGCAVMIPTMLAGGSAMAKTVGAAIRGGIAAGPGVEYFSDEWTTSVGYLKAFQLEGEASYPRILVDGGLVSYLHSYLKDSPNSNEALLNRLLAKRALDVIVREWGGRYYLNFLSPALRDELGSEYDALLGEAYHFTRKEQERFSAEGNIQVERKYAWLGDYFDELAPEFRVGYDNGSLPRMLDGD